MFYNEIIEFDRQTLLDENNRDCVYTTCVCNVHIRDSHAHVCPHACMCSRRLSKSINSLYWRMSLMLLIGGCACELNISHDPFVTADHHTTASSLLPPTLSSSFNSFNTDHTPHHHRAFVKA